MQNSEHLKYNFTTNSLCTQYKHSICFVIPYVGKIPNYFQLWLNTCKHNPSINFMLLIDDRTPYDFPENVNVRYTTLDELRSIFQSLFEFPISLETPYKLCDYKVVYGEAFSELLTKYDFWGYCDIDLFWGDIRYFLTEDILDKYDKVLTHGHCTLYKNNTTVNQYYKTLEPKGFQKYTDVFSSSDVHCFDEWGIHKGGGISHIIESNNLLQYNEAIIADIIPPCGIRNPSTLRFILGMGIDEHKKSKDRIFEIHNGKCLSHFWQCGQLHTEQYLYVHFQKRTIKIGKNVDIDHFLFVPIGHVLPIKSISKVSLHSLTKGPRWIIQLLYCSCGAVLRRLFNQ